MDIITLGGLKSILSVISIFSMGILIVVLQLRQIYSPKRPIFLFNTIIFPHFLQNVNIVFTSFFWEEHQGMQFLHPTYPFSSIICIGNIKLPQPGQTTFLGLNGFIFSHTRLGSLISFAIFLSA